APAGTASGRQESPQHDAAAADSQTLPPCTHRPRRAPPVRYAAELLPAAVSRPGPRPHLPRPADAGAQFPHRVRLLVRTAADPHALCGALGLRAVRPRGCALSRPDRTARHRRRSWCAPAVPEWRWCRATYTTETTPAVRPAAARVARRAPAVWQSAAPRT